MHSKKIPEDEKNKVRSAGGKSKLLKVKGDFKECELTSISEVGKLNTSLIFQVLQNRIPIRVATSLCYLLNLQLKIIEVENIEKRLSLIEDKLLKNNYELQS